MMVGIGTHVDDRPRPVWHVRLLKRAALEESLLAGLVSAAQEVVRDG